MEERLEAASEWVVRDEATGVPRRYAATPAEVVRLLNNESDVPLRKHDVELEPRTPPGTQLLLRKRPGGAYQVALRPQHPLLVSVCLLPLLQPPPSSPFATAPIQRARGAA